MNYYVDQILKETKISTFLEERGIYPARKSGDKLFYLCPVHQGDTAPSFVVYPIGTKGRDYETYHCFGCHSGINLINLKRDIDGISSKDALRHFLKDIVIDDRDALETAINSLSQESSEFEDQKEIENILLMINYAYKEHISVYDDEEEKGFFDNFFKEVDEVARSGDLETMESILEILIDGLEKRVDKFNERREEKDLSAMNWRL